MVAAVAAVIDLTGFEFNETRALTAGADKNVIRLLGVEFNTLDHAFKRSRQTTRELLPTVAAIRAAHQSSVGFSGSLQPKRRGLLGNSDIKRL